MRANAVHAAHAVRSSRRHRRLLLITVLVAVLVGVPGTAWALWSATTTATAPLSAAANLPRPVVSCATQPAVGLTPNFTRLTWAAVPAATSYTVRLRNLDGTTNNVLTTTSATTTDINSGLLVGLLASLLTVLTSGGTIYATVTATNANGWTSLPSIGTSTPGTPLRWANLGIVCA